MVWYWRDDWDAEALAELEDPWTPESAVWELVETDPENVLTK